MSQHVSAKCTMKISNLENQIALFLQRLVARNNYTTLHHITSENGLCDMYNRDYLHM